MIRRSVRRAGARVFMLESGFDDRQRVLDATDIVELVRESVALKPKGREWVGLCPFHDDHNPSMHVVPAKGIFHCFVCGAGGNAYDWMMRRHNMAFREALAQLAQRAGVELARRGSRRGEATRDERRGREALLKACERAQRFYAHTLVNHADAEAARRLLQRRGVTPETIERFQLGCAPDAWDALLNAAEKRGVSRETLAAAGLIRPRKEGEGHYDTLRNRLIFPIHDQLGRVVAFGGRQLRDDADGPKYLNTPESPVFDKSATLYALHHALNAIRRLDHVVVVEGYMDAIACHQAGVTNVVATMGTALTAGHARLLSRLCSTATLVFDADEAGLKAAERAIETFFPHSIDVRIATLSQGEDPDDVLRSEGGADRLRGCFESAADALTFRFSRLARRLEGAGPAAMSRAVEEELRRLLELGLGSQPPIRRRLVVSQLAALARVGEEDVLASLRALSGAGGGSARSQAPSGQIAGDEPPAKADALEQAALELVGCLLCAPALRVGLGPHDGPAVEDGRTPAGGRLLQAFAEASTEAEPGLSAVLDRLEDSAARALAAAQAARIERETGGDEERIAHRLALAVRARKRILLKREARAGLDLLTSAPNDSGAAERDPAPERQAIVAALEGRRRLERECGGDPLAFPGRSPASAGP